MKGFLEGVVNGFLDDDVNGFLEGEPNVLGGASDPTGQCDSCIREKLGW